MQQLKFIYYLLRIILAIFHLLPLSLQDTNDSGTSAPIDNANLCGDNYQPELFFGDPYCQTDLNISQDAL